jgi:hypothetical protein
MKAIQYKNKTYTIPKPFDQCNFGANPTHELTIMNTTIGCGANAPRLAHTRDSVSITIIG